MPPRLRAARCRCLVRIGMLHADVRQDFQTYIKGKLDELEPGHIDGELAKLRNQAHAALHAEGFAADQVVLERAIDLHYRGQLWSIRVPLSEDNFNAAGTRRAFEAEYQRLYGHIQPDGVIMAATLRVAARAATGTPKAIRMERTLARVPPSPTVPDQSGTTNMAGSTPPSTMDLVWESVLRVRAWRSSRSERPPFCWGRAIACPSTPLATS